jgi:hypothetical protein
VVVKTVWRDGHGWVTDGMTKIAQQLGVEGDVQARLGGDLAGPVDRPQAPAWVLELWSRHGMKSARHTSDMCPAKDGVRVHTLPREFDSEVTLSIELRG